MSDTNLDRLLRSIGKVIFISHYDDFQNTALSIQAVADRLPNEFTEKSRISRASKARRIFREGLEKAALETIVTSERLDDDITKRARELLKRHPH
jgi:hypothetical protein